MIKGNTISKPVLEFCKKYSLGDFSREDLIDFLVEYDYKPEGKTDGYDWLTVDPPGTWSEVSLAIDLGYIDEEVYEEVFNLIHNERGQK